MEPPPVDETQFVPDEGTSGVRVVDAKRFGRFRVVALIGSGATGSVYRAMDEVLGRIVAVKALASTDANIRTRFHNEARAIGTVLHPNIIAIFDAGTEGDTPYIVTELADRSLRDAMRAGRLDVEAVRSLGIQIARALAAAHAQKILHRDVKPANILDAAGVWKLADFGIARLPDSTLTDTGQFLGSPSYAAPESLRAAQFTPASDIYALAATLYEALAGAPPHGEHDMPSVVRKLEHDPPPLHLRCPVPRNVADAIMAALARDPSARPSAEDFANRLASTEELAAIAAPPAPASSRLKRVAIAAAIVASCLLAAAILIRVRDADPPEPRVFGSPRVDTAPTPKPRAPAPPPPQTATPDDPTADDSIVEPAMPAEPAPPAEANAHELMDSDGNLVDDETARRMLEQLERDARREMNGFRRFERRRGRWRRDPF